MKPTKYFNITVPELGDRPDITQVSNAIQDLEDVMAGSIEYMDAEVNQGLLTLKSPKRSTKRTGYHDGLTIMFTLKNTVGPGDITRVVVDDLPEQHTSLAFIIENTDTAIISFANNKFSFKHAPIPRSSAIDDPSTHTIATSNAVKQLNDNKVEKSINIVAGNGLSGGGTLANDVTVNLVGADDSMVVSADDVKVNTYNGVDSTSTTRPASANAVKTTYDKAVEAKKDCEAHALRTDNPHNTHKSQVGLGNVENWTVTSAVNDPSDTKYATAGAVKKVYDLANSGNTNADTKVSKSGDTMTGDLKLPNLTAHGDIFANGTVKSTGGIFDSGSRVYSPVNKPTPDNIGAVSKSGDKMTGVLKFDYDNTFIRAGREGELIFGATTPFIQSGSNYYKMYHEGFKPTPADIGAVGSRYDYLPTFDGTWGDFKNKVPAGTFTIEPTRHALLKLAGYNYGTLTVEYASAGSYKNQCVLTYVGDDTRNIQIFSNWNFDSSSNASRTFEGMWKGISDTTPIQQTNVGALKIMYRREGLIGKVWFILGNWDDTTSTSLRLNWNIDLFNVSRLFSGYQVDQSYASHCRIAGAARGWADGRGYWWDIWSLNMYPDGRVTSNTPNEFTAYSRSNGYIEIPLIKV